MAVAVLALGRKSAAFKAKLTNCGEVNGMVNTALERFNIIDILVNNAGAMSTSKPFIEKTEVNWEFDISIN